MKNLRKVAREHMSTIPDGKWLIIFHRGRGWNAYECRDLDDPEKISPEDLWECQRILAADPEAVALNGWRDAPERLAESADDLCEIVRTDRAEHKYLLARWVRDAIRYREEE